MRPFKVLGVQQIALGAASKDSLKALWVDMLGATPSGSFASARENVEEDILELGSGVFTVEVDLMQPLDAARLPRVDLRALNHVGLWVDDLDSAVNWLAAQGVRLAPGGVRQGASGHDIAFLHPKGNEEFPISGEGVLIELVQAPPAVIAAYEAARQERAPALA